MRSFLRWLALVALLGSFAIATSMTVIAQEPKKVDPPKLADVLREVEHLKRENEGLKAALRDRDTRINLATQEREFVIKNLTTDQGAPAALRDRCTALEATLRVIEKPDTGSTFDCESMLFKKKEG